jgi:sigma-B regulation protein RsbU (phosphoserine phosphatase)
VTLGTSISVAFALAFALRMPLERHYVLAAPLELRPRRQFFLELFLCLAAGSLVALFNRYVHQFYLVSGLSLLSGCLVAGFFMGLDMALARERSSIREALEKNHTLRPPRKYYPMTRRFSVVAFCLILFICIILLLVISRDFAWLTEAKGSAASLKEAERIVMIEVVFIMAVLLGLVVNLIVSYSRNLKLLFNNETRILENVSRGDLSRMVPVATRDEFGVIAGHTNNMIEGLRHRTELMQALELAEEVQRNLLPRSVTHFEGLDIAGTSLYCAETGGDYYDFFRLPEGRLGIVVADVSGHGISSALHMTTARAHLISGVRSYPGDTGLIRQLNRLLCHDIQASGWFITLFWMEIDPARKRLTWIRAGHEPALFFDPERDQFDRLEGQGVPLGIDAGQNFQAYAKQGLAPGSIVLIGTDGLHETRNPSGGMYGVDRLRQVVRQKQDLAAAELKDAILQSIEDFRADRPRDDDTTLVVVKLRHNGALS